MFSKSLLSVAIASAAIAFGANALACSTIIVGKDVSKTGTVIIGHNEDNGGRIIAQQHWVPAQTHKAGEMIKFEKSAAEIPQAEKTLGFYWTQTFSPTGASFSDGFVNEKGVTIVSNACSQIFPENKEKVKLYKKIVENLKKFEKETDLNKEETGFRESRYSSDRPASRIFQKSHCSDLYL